MTLKYLDLQVTPQGIARLTINRPEVHNAFNADVIEELADTFDDLAKQDHIRALLLTGAGQSFSAGADLEWMRAAAHYTVEDNYEDARALGTMLHRLYSMPQPTIALVNGAAIGGGVGLVAACDISIASKDAVFAFSEVKLGLIPAVISPYCIAAIGRKNARRFFVTAERFSAMAALGLGLIDEVVDGPVEMELHVEKTLKQILQNAPNAIAEAKLLIDRVTGVPLDQTIIEQTARLIADRRATDEAKEGTTAFLEKRKPEWHEDLQIAEDV